MQLFRHFQIRYQRTLPFAAQACLRAEHHQLRQSASDELVRVGLQRAAFERALTQRAVNHHLILVISRTALWILPQIRHRKNQHFSSRPAQTYEDSELTTLCR